MTCAACGTTNRADARFCRECGRARAAGCPSCGAPFEPDSKFCDACGARLGAAEAAAPGRPRPRDAAPAAVLEDERKQVTVLFADLKGSMELLAGRDPEEARRLLDAVIQRMMDATHRYGGTVNQVMGDGIMALFGAPIAHEDHAVRACYAALAMQEAVRRYGAEAHAVHTDAQIRVGLNSGEVVVRSIGNDLHMDYSAIGETVHLASRLEQLAPPGTIRMAPETARLAEGHVKVARLAPVAVKGLREPLETFELLGAVSAQTRLSVAAARGFTRFVGRAEPLGVLREALAATAEGTGSIVAVVGDAGVGKSRLFWEFTHSPDSHGWLVLETSSQSYGRATSYLPVVSLLRVYFGLADVEPRRAAELVTARLRALDLAREPILPAIFTLLDLPADDAAWRELEPAQRRQRTLDALCQLLLRQSTEQPVLLVFEDLHLIDTETQAFLERLGPQVAHARILLLANYRPDYRHPWAALAHLAELRLAPLDTDGAEALLGSLLGDAEGMDPLRRLLTEHTEGNPFFIEESVRTLVETGALVNERGAYHLARPLPAIRVPATVHAMLAARIDRLDPEDKRLLQAASAVGKHVPLSLLRAIAEVTDEALRDGLGRLQAAEFLYETSLFPDSEYTFKHALTHQVAYGSMLHDRRRALHAAIVAAIERLHAGRLDEHVDRLASHALRGELWPPAFAYFVQAATRDADRSAHHEAVTSFEQALTAAAQLPSDPGTLGRAIDVRLALRNSLLPLGESDRILTRLQEAEALAHALDDPRRLARVQAAMSNYFWSVGDLGRAVDAGERALAAGEAASDLALRVTTRFFLGQAYHALGDYPRALASLARAIESLGPQQVHERFGLAGLPSVFARYLMARTLADLGRFDEAQTWSVEAIAIAEAAGHAYSRAFGAFAAATVRVRRGELTLAIPLLEDSYALCRSGGLLPLFVALAPYLGHAYARTGRGDEALALLERAVGTPGFRVGQSLRRAALAEARLLAGRPAEAREDVEAALALAREHRERGVEAWALWLAGEITLAAGGAGAAADSYRHALDLADELGLRPLVAHARLGLARACRDSGRAAEADEHERAGHALLAELGIAAGARESAARARDA